MILASDICVADPDPPINLGYMCGIGDVDGRGGYSTESDDGESYAPPPPPALGCGRSAIGFGNSIHTLSDVSAINGSDYFDSNKFVSPRFPFSPGAFLGHHVVVSGGVDTTAHAHLNSPIIAFPQCSAFLARTHRIFRPHPSHPPYTGVFSPVVPGQLHLWPRAGMG
ncbi:hypothetical protein CYMTET_45077 [Cymbomonas tetramitiformis]|uniref:Uncharacterized protein n=1 Tax=Cymbomonas tetramitiformis TaxID=36881 RepID=A0AAE0BYY3_9CHLO|nr:hypothetical protein CYMTET_45077 [Cymbomonas tetramitiformis]